MISTVPVAEGTQISRICSEQDENHTVRGATPRLSSSIIMIRSLPDSGWPTALLAVGSVPGLDVRREFNYFLVKIDTFGSRRITTSCRFRSSASRKVFTSISTRSALASAGTRSITIGATRCARPSPDDGVLPVLTCAGQKRLHRAPIAPSHSSAPTSEGGRARAPTSAAAERLR